jgi:magnesium transporter
VRVFHITGDQFTELPSLPEQIPASGYLWVGSGRREFEVGTADVQAALQRWTGGQLVDLHVADLLNNQLPSHHEYTSWYDMLVFRRLAAGAGSASLFIDSTKGTLSTAKAALDAIDTSPVGFALFDRVLLSIHPTDCQVRDFFATRFQQQVQGAVNSAGNGGTEQRAAARLPTSAADLMLRMVNHMVDNYLELRRLLTKQLDHLQQELFDPYGNFDGWKVLLDSRNTLHLLEDICEDQRSAITEWIDALDEWPEEAEATARRERELLRVRSRDVLEHIERVLSHVRRLESSAETAVQMHFSAQGHRTNSIMRTLTVLTAIFMPLNLVTGFFGMNFEGLPLIHSMRGFWIVFSIMLFIGVSLSVFFWRKRYLTTRR